MVCTQSARWWFQREKDTFIGAHLIEGIVPKNFGKHSVSLYRWIAKEEMLNFSNKLEPGEFFSYISSNGRTRVFMHGSYLKLVFFISL